ncbi:MAG: cell division protein ZapA [Candidatus Hydrogenedens sp.]|jgi:predicted  nucleic acid-binding Zn-ribbon protein|nr:cell division protein ZapA [Candidatus Hydrogenedens sp.]
MKKESPMECKVRIAGLDLMVPVHMNLETSEKLAQDISERILEIQTEGVGINTQRDALRVAYMLAVEAMEIQAEYNRDVQELIKALERLNSSLKELVDTFHLEPLSGDD